MATLLTIDMQLSGVCDRGGTIAHVTCVVTTMGPGNTTDAESAGKVIILSDRNIITASTVEGFVILEPSEGQRKVAGHNYTTDACAFSNI